MIHEILTKDLNKRKVCARFVPRALNENQEIARIDRPGGRLCFSKPSENYKSELSLD